MSGNTAGVNKAAKVDPYDINKHQEINDILKTEFYRELDRSKDIEEKCEKHILVYTLISGIITFAITQYKDFWVIVLLGISLFFLIVAIFMSFLGLQFEERRILRIDKKNLILWDEFNYEKLLIDLTKTYSKHGIKNREMNNYKVETLRYGHFSGCIAFFMIFIALILISTLYLTQTSG